MSFLKRRWFPLVCALFAVASFALAQWPHTDPTMTVVGVWWSFITGAAWWLTD